MTPSRVVKSLLLTSLAVLLAGVLAAGQAPPKQPAQAAKSGSINNEDCAVCHEDLTKAFDKNPHVLLEKSPNFNQKNSCESCHGPGEDHASNSGDKTKIISFKGVAKRAYNQQCLACHNKDQEIAAHAASLHSKSGLACADCHRIHSGARMTKLLKTGTNDLCLGCHIQRRADFSKPFHHRVREGSVFCTDCHNPHTGMDRRQLRILSNGETACTKCHTEKKGPFVFEHAGLVIRDCQACHEPHGSVNAKMLIRSTVRGLCLECHSSSTGVLTAQPPAFHDLRVPRYQNCTTCHVKIHGSNSSSKFLR
jgi:DmsE family decaheme c-type cytochrome